MPKTTKPEKTGKQSRAKHSSVSEPTREEIEQRAYELYLARGGAERKRNNEDKAAFESKKHPFNLGEDSERR